MILYKKKYFNVKFQKHRYVLQKLLWYFPWLCIDWWSLFYCVTETHQPAWSRTALNIVEINLPGLPNILWVILLQSTPPPPYIESCTLHNANHHIWFPENDHPNCQLKQLDDAMLVLRIYFLLLPKLPSPEELFSINLKPILTLIGINFLQRYI